MRLIDADSLKEGIKELKRSPWYNNDINPSWQQGIKDAVHVVETLCIDEEPTVDAVPVVHGHWWQDEGADLNELTCSVCNKTYRMIMDLKANVYPHNYCPNCGARMDEE